MSRRRDDGKRNDPLRLAEERFRGAFEEAPIGMALVAPDGRFLRVNRSLLEIVGYSREELLSLTFQDITHPDDLDADLEYVRQVLADEIRTYQMEKRYFHKRGHTIWIALSVSLVREADGEPLHFISQIEDITERKRMEQELADAARGFELARDLICTSDFDGHLVRVNGAWSEVLGWSAEELSSRHFLEFVHPDDRERTMEVTKIFTRGGESRHFHNRWRSKDGGWRWLSWNAVGIPAEDRIYCVARDVTEDVKAQQALELQAEIAANMAEGVCVVTMATDPIIVYANPKLEQQLGYEPGELAGRRAIAVFHTPGLSSEEEAVRLRASDTLHRTGIATYVVRLVRRDGEEIWCRLTTSLFDHPKHGPVYVTVQQEITAELRARETWAEVERNKSRFFSSVSHELRTPLTSIIGYTALLLADTERLDPEQLDHLRIIHQNANRQLRLVEDLLTAASAQAGDFELRTASLDLAELVRDVADGLRPASARKNVDLRVEHAQAVDIVGDADRLAQVMANLISNAIKFTPSGGSISVGLDETREGARIRIRDTGPGLAPADRERIFERGFRGAQEPGPQEEGTGIGLAIAKSIVEAHDGRIEIAEAGAAGTTIEVGLPRMPLSAAS